MLSIRANVATSRMLQGLRRISTCFPSVEPSCRPHTRNYATIANANDPSALAFVQHHKVVIVGGGTAGITIAAQLGRNKKFKQLCGGKSDLAIIDSAKEHHYQPGWTLVGSGVSELSNFRKPEASVIPSGTKHYSTDVSTFRPDQNIIVTSDGQKIAYDFLVVAPGLKIDFESIQGLPEALSQPDSMVSTIYSKDTAEQVYRNVQSLKSGKAVFTQPAGIVKCAGAAQKILWMSLSNWKRSGVRQDIDATFATGTAAMFSVPKYSKALERLRVERKVDGLFQHNLFAVDLPSRTALFKDLANPGKEVSKPFDFLHVVPPQKSLEFIAKSPLADSAGWISVDAQTCQHTKFANIFAAGDAGGFPGSKTAAAISSQAPVLVSNLLATMKGEQPQAEYSGYSSCPILTGHGELMLCEFKYGGVPSETFAPFLGSQDKPSRLFYHLKKDIFPLAYWNSFLRGTWYGPTAFLNPIKV